MKKVKLKELNYNNKKLIQKRIEKEKTLKMTKNRQAKSFLFHEMFLKTDI